MHFRQKNQSPYFKKRQSFQSPECSTVIQINPTFQSQQSMLQKIIFPNNTFQKNNIREIKNKNQVLQESLKQNMKKRDAIIDYSKDKIKNQPQEKNLNRQKKYNYLSKQCRKQNKQNFEYRFEKEEVQRLYGRSYRSIKNFPSEELKSNEISMNPLKNNNNFLFSENKQQILPIRNHEYKSVQLPRKQNYQRSQNFIDSYQTQKTGIDEIKLRQIQAKIKRYQTKNQRNQTNILNYDQNHIIKKNINEKMMETIQNNNKVISDNLQQIQKIFLTKENNQQKMSAWEKQYKKKNNLHIPSQAQSQFLNNYQIHSNIKIPQILSQKKDQISGRKLSLRDNLQNQFQKISFQRLVPMKSHKMLPLQFISKCQNLPAESIGSNPRFHQQKLTLIRKYFQQVFTILTQNQIQSVSIQNLNLKNLFSEEIKLILGSIFTDIIILNNQYSKEKFVQQSIQNISHYKHSQLCKVIKLLQSQISNQQRRRYLKNMQFCNREPGKVLSHIKILNFENKQIENDIQCDIKKVVKNKRGQSEPKRQKDEIQWSRKDKTVGGMERVNKNVYMEATESDQAYLREKGLSNRQSGKGCQNRGGLKLMLQELKSKGSAMKNINLKAKCIEEEAMRKDKGKDLFCKEEKQDEQLQRLKTLQARFDQHFSCRK